MEININIVLKDVIAMVLSTSSVGKIESVSVVIANKYLGLSTKESDLHHL